YEEVLEYESGREPLIVGMDKYRLASVLAFYRGPMETHAESAEFTNSQWLVEGPGLGYRYWSEPSDWLGYDCVVVADARNTDLHAQLDHVFGSVEIVQDERLSKLGKKRYQIAICRGYTPAASIIARR